MEYYDLPTANPTDAMTYEQAMAALKESQKFGIEPSLEGTKALADFMGKPQDTYTCIQVAGTNGKSSTVRLVASILRAHGYSVGLYTSPELVYYPERMEVDGKVVSRELFGRAIGDTVRAGRELVKSIEAGTVLGADGKPLSGIFTEFELLTVAALHLFALAKVDFAVLEVGMGGRWDATSIVEPKVACITGIGLDHTAILGDTVEAIAGEKAAIIKPGSIPILGPGTANTTQVFLDRTRETGTSPVAVREGFGSKAEYSPVDETHTVRYAAHLRNGVVSDDIVGRFGKYNGIGMRAPSYQKPNIATAVAICEAALDKALSLTATQSAVIKTSVPGRFETLSRDPLLIIDAAHNPESATVLAGAICERFTDATTGQFKKPTLLIGVLADKDVHGIVEALAPVAARFVVSASDSPRRLEPEALADIVEDITGERPDAYATFEEALAVLRKPELRGMTAPSVVCSGSITVAGEVKRLSIEGLI